MNRLRLRAAAVPCAAALVLTAVLAGCSAKTPPVSTIGTLAFDNALRIPPLAESTADAAGRRTVHLTARAGSSSFLPGTTTPTWGFNGDYLGPTIVADRGDLLRVTVGNRLDARTTVHWHGMHLPARMDGGPHQMIDPGDDWTPEWTVDQPAATLWYHPHPHGETADHMGRGLAGMLIVRDPAEAALALPRDYGIDDVPVIVQDVRFDAEGALVSDTRDSVGPLGDQLLVNGTLAPRFEATTDVVRLRLLNASPARVFAFVLSDGREMALIGTDGGLLERPYPTGAVRLSPGERAEVLVALRPGDLVDLRSTGVDLGGGAAGGSANGAGDSFDVLRIAASASPEHRGAVPETLVPLERLDDLDATAERRFVLDGRQINQQRMDLGRIDEVVTLGATEVWDVRNNTAQPHSFHVHDVQFQLLSAAGEPPPPELAGWKDTILLAPNSDYRLVMRFTDYADATHPYMYHCHLLTHEDAGMMGQFVVVEPGGRAGPVESGDAHHGG